MHLTGFSDGNKWFENICPNSVKWTSNKPKGIFRLFLSIVSDSDYREATGTNGRGGSHSVGVHVFVRFRFLPCSSVVNIFPVRSETVLRAHKLLAKTTFSNSIRLVWRASDGGGHNDTYGRKCRQQINKLQFSTRNSINDVRETIYCTRFTYQPALHTTDRLSVPRTVIYYCKPTRIWNGTI